MQTVFEVYSYDMDLEEQLQGGRVWNIDVTNEKTGEKIPAKKDIGVQDIIDIL